MIPDTKQKNEMKADDIEDAYGLSPMQHGMLFQNLNDQQTGVDIEQMVCSLREDVRADEVQ